MPAYDADRFAPPAPLALVTLRQPENAATLANVPMLIDTGADVTLIPQTAATQLGVPINAGATYELIGFDGTKSVAQSVQLDLLFLRRAFSGRFLLIDHAWGILGRDVLNHVTIALNGPRLAWNEEQSSP